MATRVSAAEVREIIEIDATLDIDSFILAANTMVTIICTDASLTVAQLKEIERWLSAHLVAIREPRAQSRKAGPFSEAYMFKVALGLKVTRYGQQAIWMDTSGALEQANKEDRISTQLKYVGI